MSEKIKIIFTTLLIEKSPQALPLGAACVASSVKHDPLTKDITDVHLVPFNKEDSEYLIQGQFPKEFFLILQPT